ncbi:nucleotidyltransferase family protein [Labilibaculum sp.]|uniref:nucleotidyltransferase family protein n=1 Tax=Labilibaculum sp. TaxID=2060723 RepID=UPI002AA92CC4|nr:nucleotidyltransferase family protein [Labilibaculum sp.]MBN2596967.1 nucleotidyltransferase family protein [Marinifilaceae bacterium]
MLNAMIFAAGLGTRLKPFTDSKPKALVELAGKPLLERAILKLIELKVDRIVINVHHYADLIEDFLRKNNNFGVDIRISDEREELLDTGGGLKNATDLFIPDAPVLIYNVDVFSSLNLSELINFHKLTGALVSMVVRERNSSRYLYFNKENQLTGWKNCKTGEIKKTGEDMSDSEALAFSGIHVISPKLFSLIREEGKFSIIDMYLRLAKNEKILAFKDSSQIWTDLGKPEDLAWAEEHLK